MVLPQAEDTPSAPATRRAPGTWGAGASSAEVATKAGGAEPAPELFSPARAAMKSVGLTFPKGAYGTPMGPYGPRDFTHEIVSVPSGITLQRPASTVLALLGPPTPFQLQQAPEGLTVTPSTGRFPVFLTLLADDQASAGSAPPAFVATPAAVATSAEGASAEEAPVPQVSLAKPGTHDTQIPNSGMPRALRAAALRPIRLTFRMEGRDQPVVVDAGLMWPRPWTVKFFGWPTELKSKGQAALQDEAAWQALFGYVTPLVTQTLTKLDWMWGGAAPHPNVPGEFFAVMAETSFELTTEGRYAFQTISDDGIRILVDDRPVLSNWTHHAPTQNRATATLAKGPHTLTVHYCQITGTSQLQVNVLPE